MSRDLPAFGAEVPPTYRVKLERLREELQVLLGYRGNPLDRAVLVRDITDGIDLPNGGGTIIVNPGGGIGEEPDLTPPPTPTGLVVEGGITTLFIAWDLATYTLGHGPGQTNIYGVQWPDGDPAPTFVDAVLLGAAPHAMTSYGLEVNPATRWAIWIKFQSADGVESASPAGGTNGVSATSGQDVSSLLEILSGAITDGQLTSDFSFRADRFVIRAPDGSPVGIAEILPFVVQTTDMTVNGVLIPKGVYMDAAYIKNLTAAIAQLGNAWIDSAMVGSLNAINLTAGNGTIGGNLRSSNYLAGSTGWLLTPGGFLEAGNATIRGTVTATAGAIGGNTITSTAITSPGFVAGSVGWRAQSTGTFEAYSNAGDRRFNLAATGTTPVLKIGTALSILGNGVATFAGALSAATGTFAGSLSAATGTFSGSLSAASGTFSGSLTASAVNAVDTLNLRGQAVTIPVSAYSSGTVANNTADDEQIQSVVIVSSGAPIAVFAGCGRVSTGNLNTAIFSVKRNGSTIITAEVGLGDGNAYGGPCVFPPFRDTPGAGTHTYTMWMRTDFGGGSVTASQRGMVLIETKR